MRELGVRWTIDIPLVSDRLKEQQQKEQQQKEHKGEKNNVKQQQQQITTTTKSMKAKEYHGGDTALVTIAVGEKSRAFGRILVRSFLLHSEFAGPLYIVTDDIDYFYQSEAFVCFRFLF
jgi:hypothetical protein